MKIFKLILEALVKILTIFANNAKRDEQTAKDAEPIPSDLRERFKQRVRDTIKKK